MNEETTKTAGGEETITSLREFMEEYQKTISVIGVFITVGLFWKTLYQQSSIPYVSYLCFLISIPLFWEVRMGYNKVNASWNLRFFIDILTSILFFTAWNLFTEYPDHSATIINGLIWMLIIIGLFALIEKISKYFTDKKYNEAVEYRENLIKEIPDLESRNILINSNNEVLKSYYNLVDAGKILGTIIAIILAFYICSYTSDFLHAVFENNKQIPEVPEVSVPR